MSPVFCANTFQNAYVAETSFPTDISSILCVSNNTKQPITYEIVGISSILEANFEKGKINCYF